LYLFWDLSVNRAASAFDSDEERARVAILLDQYNHPPKDETKSDEQANSPVSSESDKSENSSDDSSNSDENADSDDNANSDNESEEADDKSDESSDDESEDAKTPPVKMTAEIDDGFAQIAQERINRAPVRYYFWLPARRAVALWFDTHSAYYPFAGELFPLDKLDREEHQEIWLPVFIGAMWIYTLLAAAGAFVLWLKRKNGLSLCWLFLVTLMSLPRVAFFATLENPEPRYVVELFAFASILGGIAIAQLKFKKEFEKEKLND
jgi:hypothetical protein